MSGRKPYRSDLSDEQWALIEPVITAWKAEHRSVSGHTGRYEMREIVNALLYQSRTGCQWDYLPHDLPPRGAVYYYFAKWRDDGTDQTIHDLLRWQVRESRGREADPSLVLLDTQSVHAAAGVPAVTTGKDAAKKVPGRKRGLAVDVLGLVIAVIVLAASVHDNTAGTALLDRVAAQSDTVRKVLVDQGFKTTVVSHGASLGIDVEIVERNPAGTGFVPQPKRWVVEQTLGTLNLQRRLVRDYEHRTASSESRVYWAMTAVIARRLTGTTPAWRDA
ncbi:IS4 family transposase [Streptomyces sp. 2333.5]|uniref:IS5 family transposase n=1 Tax=unclassified Streptomyces TaxID=2593676 RepID=UPI00089C719A|nr:MULTISPECIES: IS5 family transposase [unclassified Streptomyces]PJJ06571.1 IS4 family transposase [Streptomyces sp. 2333.5]SEE97058.1 transposase, IS4 family [Streptomyces sp. 2314.4]SEF11197.1 Transposase [Streptomyces sp. 2112.2]